MSSNSKAEAALEDIDALEMNKAKKNLQRIYGIWQEFGLELIQKTDRAIVIWKHVQNLLEDIYEEEITLYEGLKERHKNYTKEIIHLCNVLKVKPDKPKGAFIKMEDMLIQELDKLKKLKQSRVEAYEYLKNVEIQYCQILNLTEHQLPTDTEVPSENDISELEERVQMLEDEKEKRQKKFFLAKKELATILETTELAAESSFEKDIMSGKDTPSLSDETFKVLEEELNKAQKRKAELENKKEGLIDRLTVLWQRLNVDETRKVEFLTDHVDCKLSTIQSIEQELEACETIKKTNIGIFISNLRIELLQLWDKCHVSQSERDLFNNSSTESSDEIFAVLEAEVDKLKKYYQKVEHILKKIEKWQNYWNMMVVLENKAMDPNRFKNRKGNLLKEEKDRKKLQKDLPILEKDILCNIEELEANDESIFLYDGEDFKTFINNQRSKIINKKESEKVERHPGHEATPGTPLKRPLKTTPKSTPSKYQLNSTMGGRSPAPRQ